MNISTIFTIMFQLYFFFILGKIDYLLFKLFRIFQRGVCAAFLSLHVADKEVGLLHHPTVALRDSPLRVGAPDTFGYHHVVVIFLVVFHILFGVREHTDKLIVRLAHSVLHTFNDRSGVDVKLAVTTDIYFHKRLRAYQVLQKRIEPFIKCSVSVKVTMTEKHDAVGVITKHSCPQIDELSTSRFVHLSI